jgi:hypothetical protein
MTAARALAGAVAGGVLAALLVDLETPTLVVITLVAVVVGVAVAMLLVDTRAPTAPAPQGQPGEWWSRPAAAPAPVRPAAALPEQPQRVVLGTGHGGQWWEQTGAPAARPATTRLAPQAPELTSYVESARVVQCPRCGAFRIDVTRSGAEFSFHCNQDGHRWTWRRDTAWPLTVVVSRRRA